MQNYVARIVNGSGFDTLGQPLIKMLGWKTKDELIASDSNVIVFKSFTRRLNELCAFFSHKRSSYALGILRLHQLNSSSSGARPYGLGDHGTPLLSISSTVNHFAAPVYL